MDYRKKILISKLSRDNISLSNEELEDIIKKYDSMMLFLFENDVINDKEAKHRWNFIYRPYDKYNCNYKLLKTIINVTKADIYHLFPLNHLYIIHGLNQLIGNLKSYLDLYNTYSKEHFISYYLNDYYWMLSESISCYYVRLMNSYQVTNDYKSIITSLKKILDKVELLHWDSNENIKRFMKILYLYIVINNKNNNLEDVEKMLIYISEHLKEIDEIMKLYGPRTNFDVYILVDTYYNEDKENKIIIK